METDKTTSKPDWLTVAAIAVVAHALSVSIHKALGHGGTCIAVGCTPRLLITMQVQGDEQRCRNWRSTPLRPEEPSPIWSRLLSRFCACAATAVPRALVWRLFLPNVYVLAALFGNQRLRSNSAVRKSTGEDRE
jgi:hypothetical protein